MSMDPSQIPKGAGQMEVTEGKAVNQPGVYRHAGSGAELIVLPDSQSTAHSDALVRLGYERVDNPPTREELHKMQNDQRVKDKKLEDQGIMPGLAGADPNAPKFNGTLSPTAETEGARADAAEARAAELERELETAKAQAKTDTSEADAKAKAAEDQKKADEAAKADADAKAKAEADAKAKEGSQN